MKSNLYFVLNLDQKVFVSPMGVFTCICSYKVSFTYISYLYRYTNGDAHEYIYVYMMAVAVYLKNKFNLDTRRGEK